MKWKYFSHHWHIVKEIHWSPVDSPCKWPLMLSLDAFFTDNPNKLYNYRVSGYLSHHETRVTLSRRTSGFVCKYSQDATRKVIFISIPYSNNLIQGNACECRLHTFSPFIQGILLWISTFSWKVLHRDDGDVKWLAPDWLGRLLDFKVFFAISARDDTLAISAVSAQDQASKARCTLGAAQ